MDPQLAFSARQLRPAPCSCSAEYVTWSAALANSIIGLQASFHHNDLHLADISAYLQERKVARPEAVVGKPDNVRHDAAADDQVSLHVAVHDPLDRLPAGAEEDQQSHREVARPATQQQ